MADLDKFKQSHRFTGEQIAFIDLVKKTGLTFDKATVSKSYSCNSIIYLDCDKTFKLNGSDIDENHRYHKMIDELPVETILIRKKLENEDPNAIDNIVVLFTDYLDQYREVIGQYPHPLHDVTMDYVIIHPIRKQQCILNLAKGYAAHHIDITSKFNLDEEIEKYKSLKLGQLRQEHTVQ